MEGSTLRMHSLLETELYFLIVKFLEKSSCSAAANVLKHELETMKILPKRIDWKGNFHDQTFKDLDKQYPHISADYLLQICSRIGSMMEKEVLSSIPGFVSLLGTGRQSVLRRKEDFSKNFRSITDYSIRFGGMPSYEHSSNLVHNIVRVLQGRENSGPLHRREAIPTQFYSKMQLYRYTLGHLSAVYCVLYDQTGKYIITGADDLLVKVWSAIDGRLLATFRGASSEIMDIAVSFDNSLLAAGSLDKILRVWCFQTMSPVAVLSGHSGMITSVNFCPISCNGVNYLVSTSNDGSVAFWSYIQKTDERAIFQSKPIQYHEKMRPGQAQMICASFSPGGAFMAAGSADHHVRVYIMFGDEGPRRILETEAHSDTVDSIQWAHAGLRFISGSKDGTAIVWNFKQQQWVQKRLLMSTKLPGDSELIDDTNKKAKVTMVCWDVSDEWVITAVNDSTLRVWNSNSGGLVKILRGHKDEVFVLEAHPIDPRIVLSAGHDGQLIVWDVLNSEPITCFQNFIEGQGNGAVFDAKWSPDGTMLAATDSHGHLLMYGFGTGVEKLKIVPKELFFHTDYRPLIRDTNNYVLDEQTQTAPHLMPPPFLVDVDGNPYPPALQRLVPGRENCRGEQLVPNIAVGVGGVQEVIEGLPVPEPRSNIDRLIEALAQRQNIIGADNEDIDDRDDTNGDQQFRQISSPRGNRSGLRRIGNVEGVRQSSGNWQRDNTTPWNKPILVRPIKSSILKMRLDLLYSMADAELECWKKEMKKRPQSSVNVIIAQGNLNNRSSNCKRNRGRRHGYRTRSARDEVQNDEEFNNMENLDLSRSSISSNNSDSSAHEEDMSSDSTSESSSEYSDWIADHGLNLEPPKRSKRKPVKKRSPTPPSDIERRKNQRLKKKVVAVPNGIAEVPEIFRPSEWLTEVIPRKAPYYPQMGDEIVYFRQGHNLYLDAVRNKKVYEIGPRCEPWSKMNIKAQEFVKVVGIKYEIRPPRLCCLKLALLDEDGCLTGENFTVKYHDMADVLDFLVLRQTFETALTRNWSVGDRFRCMIDDGWWMGQIESVEPLDEEFPESYFMCFRVRWDNGEYEKMSPWDLELTDNERLPLEIGGAVPVLPEEIQTTLYQPKSDEWPMGDREATCRRIIRGIDQVMSLAIAEPFITPVDLNIYPSYAFVVEYPIDLSTIKTRLENHFYRRKIAAQFDVRYLATNAEKFNEPHSQIVKSGRIVTDLCLKIIRETTEIDVPAVYHQLVDTYHSSDSEIELNNRIFMPSTSQGLCNRNLRSHKNNHIDWKLLCRQLLETLWQCDDSIPFREPVDRLEHPDYYQIIDTPMDLRTIKEDLSGGNYETPQEFAKDMRLIFTNSRNYNTNKKSRIYSMTIRLSAMFEEHMRKIIYTWKSVRRRNQSNKNKKRKYVFKKSNNCSKNSAGTSRKQLTANKVNDDNDDDDDDNDDDDDDDDDDHDDDGDDDDDDDDDNDDDDDDDNDDDDDYRNTDYNNRKKKTFYSGHKKRILQKKHTTLYNGPGPSRTNNCYNECSTKSIPMKLRTTTTKTITKTMVKNESESSIEDNSSDSSTVYPTKTKKHKDSDDSDSTDSYEPEKRRIPTRKNSVNKSKYNNRKNKKLYKYRNDDNSNQDHDHTISKKEQESTGFQSFDSDSENDKIQKNCKNSRKTVEVQEGTPTTGYDFDEYVSEESIDGYKQAFSQVDSSTEESDSNGLVKVQKKIQSQREISLDNNHVNENSTEYRTRRKRPRYNEESDEHSSTPIRNRRRVKRRYYAEDSEDSGPGPGISISSRGRVRKMTAKARAFLLESP